jgi:flavin-binding protein dodecin
VYKSIEVTGTATTSIAAAVQGAVEKACETVRHVDWFELVSVRGTVADGRVEYFQATIKLGFRLE